MRRTPTVTSYFQLTSRLPRGPTDKFDEDGSRTVDIFARVNTLAGHHMDISWTLEDGSVYL